jgi:hypothetical protein
MPRTARASGPSYRNGARAAEIELGGQSTHDRTGSSNGRPHRSLHGAVMTPTWSVHPGQSGHPAPPHDAQRGGNSTSSRVPMRRTVPGAADTDAGRYGRSSVAEAVRLPAAIWRSSWVARFGTG